MKVFDADIEIKIIDLIKSQLKRVDGMRYIVRNDVHHDTSYLTRQESQLLEILEYVKADICNE